MYDMDSEWHSHDLNLNVFDNKVFALSLYSMYFIISVHCVCQVMPKKHLIVKTKIL